MVVIGVPQSSSTVGTNEMLIKWTVFSNWAPCEFLEEFENFQFWDLSLLIALENLEVE